MPTVCRTTDSAGPDGTIGKKVSIGKDRIVSKIQIIETIYSENTRKIEKYFEIMLDKLYLMKYNEDNKKQERKKQKKKRREKTKIFRTWRAVQWVIKIYQ